MGRKAMALIQPWPIAVAVESLAKELDDSALIQELLHNPNLGRHATPGTNTLREEDTPLVIDFVREHVQPEVATYIRNQYRRLPEELRSETWALFCTDGRGLEPHLHSGSALVTTALYLTDSHADLVLMDPRGNACRGFPPDIRAASFGNYRHTPRFGDLVIFPCYLEHYVATGPQELRVSVLSDWYFK
jgi:hypothetical protein